MLLLLSLRFIGHFIASFAFTVIALFIVSIRFCQLATSIHSLAASSTSWLFAFLDFYSGSPLGHAFTHLPPPHLVITFIS